MYRLQPSTLADRLLPLAESIADAADRLAEIVEIMDVNKQLLILFKERMAARSTRSPPIFRIRDLLYLPTRGLYVRSKKSEQIQSNQINLI